MNHMPEEVSRAADALVKAIENTDSYQEYAQLKESVMADEVNRRLLDRLSRAQSALQSLSVRRWCRISGTTRRSRRRSCAR